MARSATQRSRDLTLRRLPVLRWTGESSLGEVYERAEQAAHDAIDWYPTEKKRKARWSRGLPTAEQESQLTGPQLPPTPAKAENGGLGSARI
ncbi:hypothetical protein [Amycolatopsis balhimycina]|uniref:hypothetical protein n=1 Tax=Amycolatopsis balhimycina TaxID=208443 RepID=UPI000F76E757|nr:hypothetical protein [Amycolatopsis balhimycina]